MISTSHLLAFVVASLVLVVVPGPSVLFVLGRSLTLGRRAGLLSVVGNTSGLLPVIALVAAGVGAVVAGSVVWFTALKFAGAAYLVYLGVQAIRHRRDVDVDLDPVATSAWRIVRTGFVVGSTNPKALVFLAAVLPQFVEPDRGAVPLQIVTFGLIFTAVAFVSDAAWAIAAGSARDWLGGSPRRLARLRGAGGAMMIGLGGILATTGHRAA